MTENRAACCVNIGAETHCLRAPSYAMELCNACIMQHSTALFVGVGHVQERHVGNLAGTYEAGSVLCGVPYVMQALGHY